MSTAPTRRRLIDVLRWVLLVVVVASVTITLVRNWQDVGPELRRVDAQTWLLALMASLLSPIFAMLGWRAILAGLGTRLRVANASAIFFVGQLGKYLPGSVWTVVVQSEMGARLGIPRQRSAVAGIVTLAMSVFTGLLVGLPAVPLLLGSGRGSGSAVLFVIAAIVGVIASSPPVLNRLLTAALRLLRREPLEHRLSATTIVTAVGWFTAAWLVMGAAILALARAVAPTTTGPGHLVVASICGWALAGVLGMLSFLIPAGVGVRDGLLVLIMDGLLPLPAATAVVVISRFLTVLTDIVVAALGWLWGRRHHLVGGEP